ncbi:hypothetical protein MTR67_012077 [Solanum verrucosum]|uniref:DUF4216 domain-containing protein n=1 Tax=Solanum verrucosum TaxID=315347 RepID=A0AAF0Q961_SOLVR|nr:hypothetical protein MTR67_012077 [Solanum verrucosum]
MHIEKNIVDSIIGTLLDISGKTKDHPNTRYDLKEMVIGKSLQPKDTKDGRKVKLPTACFSMSKGEKSIFCGVLKKAKLPDGAKKGEPTFLDKKSRHQAHGYILNNCDEVLEYIRKHELEVSNQGKGSKWSKDKNHSQRFSQWFEARVMHEDVSDLIKHLLRGPNSVAKRYAGYIINVYRFQTRRREAKRKTQNSVVTLVALTTSFASSKDKNQIDANLTYYGKIVDILELDYYNHFKVVLFKCEWYEAKEDIYGFTYVYFNERCSQEEPFLLASQAHQCFYVKDPYDDDKHYVMKIVPRDLFSMSDEAKFDVPQSYINEPYDDSMGPSIPRDNGEVDLVRSDIPATVIKVYPREFVVEEPEHESED